MTLSSAHTLGSTRPWARVWHWHCTLGWRKLTGSDACPSELAALPFRILYGKRHQNRRVAVPSRTRRQKSYASHADGPVEDCQDLVPHFRPSVAEIAWTLLVTLVHRIEV